MKLKQKNDTCEYQLYKRCYRRHYGHTMDTLVRIAAVMECGFDNIVEMQDKKTAERKQWEIN